MARDGSISGGRKKGSLNKKTIDSLNRAESILQLIESEYLVEDIKKLTSSQRSALYKDLLQYRAPMLTRIDQRIQANVNLSDEPITFE
jgi:hypothetical protein